MFNKFNPFKKSLSGLLALFVILVEDLRQLASDKAAEAAEKEAKVDKLKQEIDEALVEAEEALNAADKIEDLIGGSSVLSACAEKL